MVMASGLTAATHVSQTGQTNFQVGPYTVGRRLSILAARFFAVVVAATFLITSASATGDALQTVRQTLQLTQNWRFNFGDAGDAVVGAQFDDGKWELVSVPHTWNRLGEFGTERTAATNSQRGIGWYRLQFTAPTVTRDQRQYLQFDAVATIADVWLNGKKLGTHSGAFSRFRFDVTDVLRSGQSNLLVVKADNSKAEPGSNTQDIIPLAGDFFIHGGIYRGVSLFTTNAVHVDALDYAGPGVYAQTPTITNERADVAVLTRLRNDAKTPRKISVVTRVLDAAGNEISKSTEKVRLTAGSNAEVHAKLTVPNPHLWNGQADAYLYSVKVEIRDGTALLDAVEQPLGIRSYRVDANEGLFLNGKLLPLHGVSRHQDRAGKGWALSKADHEGDMALIAELGANAVRFAHYQHAQEWFDLADRYGMLVWSEIPFVHQAGFTPDEPTPALVANARQQLMEEIRQNYNHPSVFTWSVGNEIDIGVMLHHGKAGKSLELLRNLHELAKHEDPSRLTTFADCCEPPPMTMKGAEPLAGATDLIGYNRYYGWYYGKPAGLGTTMDIFHQRHPKLPMSISEYGAGAATSQHTDNPLGGAISAMGRPHAEEFQSWYHEQSWPQIRSRPYIWGSFIWNMFDFASDMREEGDSIDINDKGLVSYDRKVKKDAFYYHKAQWSSEPVVHINSSRYTQRAYAMTDVRVYSNAPTVRLKLNGSDLGSATCEDRICVWRDVTLHAGANTVTAIADFAGGPVTDSVNWTGPDPANGIRIDSGNLVGHRSADGQLFGSDNFFIGGDSRLLNSLSGGGFTAANKAPPKVVAGATDAALYDGYRVGTFSYDIPAPNGEWKVTLYSFEPTTTIVDTRTFNVIANGRTQLTAWSPGKTAGGAFKAAEVSFKVKVQDGRLKLQFEPNGGPAIVAAITITH